MSLAGKIGDFSVLEVIQFIHSTQKTGVLHFQQSGEIEAQIYFQEGHIIRASTSGVTRIGNWLCQKGHITQKMLEQALASQATSTPKRPLGMVLKEMGHVTHETVRNAIIHQIEEVVAALLRWKAGSFHFAPQDTNTPDHILLMLEDLILPEEVNTEILLLEAVWKFDQAATKQVPESKEPTKTFRRLGIAVKEMVLKLHLKQFTGKVSLQKDRIEKAIFFKNGNPVFVDSTIRGETLGQMLLEKGALTESQYDLVLQKMESEGRRQGEILVELGFLTAFEVFELLTEQMAQKIQNSFLLDGAEALIEEGISHLENIPQLPTDFFQILLHSFSANEESGHTNQIPRDRALLLNSQGKEYLLSRSLLPLEGKIVRLLDGNNTIEEVGWSVGRDLKIAEAFIQTLAYMHFLEFVDKSEEKRQLAGPLLEELKKAKSSSIETSPTSPIYSWALRLDRPYHELLKINLHAPSSLARNCFDSIVHELHLDAIEEHYQEKERKVAELVLDRLTLAVTILSDEKRQKEYVENVGVWKTKREALAPAVAAEMCMRKAKLHLAKKRFKQAEKEISQAIEFDPKESSYHLELADALYQRALMDKKGFPDRIERELTEARKLDSSNSDAHFQFGRLAKAKKDFERARNYFQRAIQLKPDHAEALFELRMLRRRSEAKEGAVFRFVHGKRLARVAWVGGCLILVALFLYICGHIYFDVRIPASELQLPVQIEKATIHDDGLLIIVSADAWHRLSLHDRKQTLTRIQTTLREKKLRQAKIMDQNQRILAAVMETPGSKVDSRESIRIYH